MQTYIEPAADMVEVLHVSSIGIRPKRTISVDNSFHLKGQPHEIEMNYRWYECPSQSGKITPLKGTAVS